jgi:CheY-like chemotaxis protein
MSISVLVVTDDADIRDTVRVLLESEGYLVHCAENADRAIDLLGRVSRPCILLWDATAPRHSLSMVDRATLEGVHVASLPVSIASVRAVGSSERETSKRLVCEDVILSIVREHCPLTQTTDA